MGREFFVEKKHAKIALSHLKKRTDQQAEKLKDIRRKCFRQSISSKSCSVITPFSNTYVMLQLRNCFLRHKWDDATRLLLMLLDEGSVRLKKMLWKSCLYTLIYHPKSTQELREEFIRMCTGISDAEELLNSMMTFLPKDEISQKSKTESSSE